MKPCVRCLCEKIRRTFGADRFYKIIQCFECGFNVSAKTWEEAERKWNGFKVWTLVPEKEELGKERFF